MSTALPANHQEAELLDAAPVSGPRPTLEEQARAFLAVEAQIAALKAQADEQRAALLSRMESESELKVTVRGAGSISYVASSTRTSLDTKAALALLSAHEIPAPLTPSNVKASLRVALNK
jgi:hypothetical protein